MSIEGKHDELHILVERFKNGDKPTFDEIYKRCAGHVAFVCSKLYDNPQDVEEIVQDTFAIIYKKQKELKPETFLPYLRKIATNACYQKHKKASRQVEQVTYSEQFENDLPELDEDFLPEEYLENKESRSELIKVLKQLPPKQNEMIVMYYYAQMSTAEIAKNHNCSTQNVNKTLRAARATIKTKLESKGFVKTLALVPLSAVLFVEETAYATSYVVSAGIMTATTTATIATTGYAKVIVAGACIAAVGVVSSIIYFQGNDADYSPEPYVYHQEQELAYEPIVIYKPEEHNEPEEIEEEIAVEEVIEIEPEIFIEPEPEPEPEPIDRTDQILVALELATNQTDLDIIINYFDLHFLSRVRGSGEEEFRFYMTNEGSGDILVGASTYEDGTNWWMRFKFYPDSQSPESVFELISFMQ